MSHYSTRSTCLLYLPPLPLLLVKHEMLGFTKFTSIRLDDQIQVSTQSVTPQHGMQPDQIVLSLLQLCPGQWHPGITELMDGCLPDAPSYYKVGEEKKGGKRKRKKPETWMKHLYSWEALTSENRKPVRKPGWPHCFRDTQPSRSAGSNGPGPACGLQRVPFCSALLIPPSLFSPLLAQTSPSYGIWGQEFHQLKIT